MSSILIFHLIVQDPSGTKHTFEIHTGPNLIGRQAGLALQLDQQKISRQHARIDCDGQECILTDLASANGTRLNGKKLQPQVPYRLDLGAVIAIGDFTLILEQARIDVPEPAKPADSLIDVIHLPPAPEEGARPVPVSAEEATPEELAGEFEKTIESARTPDMAVPPTQPPLPPAGSDGSSRRDELFPGSSGRSRFLIRYLPEAYWTDFMECFLGLFESILLPIEWNIDNFDLFLAPSTSPAFFLPWLEAWFSLDPDATWNESQRRQLLAEAHHIYAMRGTRWALSRVLEIYTGQKPVINDTGKDLQPHTFTVRLTGRQLKASRKFIQKIIEDNKPAHTTYTLEIVE
jgi:phage tail-like protein